MTLQKPPSQALMALSGILIAETLQRNNLPVMDGAWATLFSAIMTFTIAKHCQGQGALTRDDIAQIETQLEEWVGVAEDMRRAT